MSEVFEPFNPEDPMDAMAEMFRLQVTQLRLDADKVALFRDLDQAAKLQCFLAGAMTAVVGVALCSVDSDGADNVVAYIEQMLPYARQQAEGIRAPDGSVLKNHHDKASAGVALRPDAGGGGSCVPSGAAARTPESLR